MPLAKLDAFPRETVVLSQFAKSLAHPARIAILTYLDQHGERPAMDIVSALPLSQPATSRHIRELHHADLLKTRLDGNRIFYRLNVAEIRRFCDSFSSTLHPH